MTDEASSPRKDSQLEQFWFRQSESFVRVCLPPGSPQARLWARKGVQHLIKFGLVGFSGLLVNLGLFTILQRVVPHSDALPVFYLITAISFLAGGVSNFFLNRSWVFKSDGHAVREGAQFITVSIFALMVNLIVVHFVSPVLGHGHRTVLLATFAAIIVNFFVNKYWTFRGK